VHFVAGMVVLTCGRTVDRNVHENWAGFGQGRANWQHDPSWRVERISKSFVESAVITVPLRALDELLEALTQVARIHPKSA
jgi:hypothetical protein